MIITQERLLQASVHYNLNIDAVEKDVNMRKPVLHILHSPEDFRLVEGMIMLLNSAHIGGPFSVEFRLLPTIITIKYCGK